MCVPPVATGKQEEQHAISGWLVVAVSVSISHGDDDNRSPPPRRAEDDNDKGETEEEEDILVRGGLVVCVQEISNDDLSVIKMKRGLIKFYCFRRLGSK